MIISKAAVADILGVPLNESLEKQYDFLISWVQSRAESFIGRSLEVAERTVYLDGSGKQTLILPVIPVQSITSISIDQGRIFETAVSEQDYYCDLKSGILYFDYPIPNGKGIVKIVYTAGFDSGSLPYDLRMAMIECISWNIKRLNDKAFGVSNRNSPEGISPSYEMVLPMGAQRVFELYRDVKI